MSRRFRFLALLPLLLAVGCDSGASFDVSAYVGTYAGTRTITEGPDGQGDVQSITITILANEDAGTVRLALDPEFGPAEVLNGTYDDDGFLFRAMEPGFDFTFTAGPDGAVRGTSSTFGQEGTISGTFTPSRIDLTFEAEDPAGVRTEIRTRR